MILPPLQTLAIIAMVTLGTAITRFLPFALFSGSRRQHSYLTYLGKMLPYCAIGLLVVYCLEAVRFEAVSLWLPEALAILCIVALHTWKSNVLLSIGGGTVLYMLLVQLVF